MLEDSHRAMKRWERARQWEGLRKEPDNAGPLAWCRVRPAGGPDRVPVRLLALYAGDFAYVRAAGEAAPPGAPGHAWMTRGGIDWEGYLPAIVRQYALGRPVPPSFAPVRKLPTELIDRLAGLPARALPEVFAKLRDEGLLPVLPALSRGTRPEGLPWEDLRARFLDFRLSGTDGALRDNPPR